MANDLDTSWHTSTHSRHQPASPPTTRRRGSGVANSTAMKDQGRQSSMKSVEEDVGESTRTLSVETHDHNHHNSHNDDNHHINKNNNDDDDDDDDYDSDDDDDVDSFGETSPTERTDAATLEKCLASGVSSRLMDFRINYDSKANLDDDDEYLDSEKLAEKQKQQQLQKQKEDEPKKRRNIGSSMAKALRRVVYRSNNTHNSNNN